ncbi:unnamed protein product, partial [Symbiodinium sp. CCMP2456]
AAKLLHQTAVAEGTVEFDVGTLGDEPEQIKQKKRKPGAAKSQPSKSRRTSSPSRRSTGGTSATNASKSLGESEQDMKTLRISLQRICQRLGRVPQCFLCLNEGVFLEPWGRSVDHARRMLNQMEKDSDRNQHLLRPHVLAAEAAILLKDGNLRKMSKTTRLTHVQAFEGANWTPPVTIYVQHCVAEFDTLDYMAATDIDKVIGMLMPVELDPQVAEGDQADVAWEWQKPTFTALVAAVAGRYARARLFGDAVDTKAEAEEMEA